jgi:hypothetical protein
VSAESGSTPYAVSASSNELPSSPGWLLAGYLLGLLAMSPAPVLRYWYFAPFVPLVVVAACVLAGIMDRRFHAAAARAAAGAAAAAVFGAVTVVVLLVELASIS